jgi:hypothetical protein
MPLTIEPMLTEDEVHHLGHQHYRAVWDGPLTQADRPGIIEALQSNRYIVQLIMPDRAVDD